MQQSLDPAQERVSQGKEREMRYMLKEENDTRRVQQAIAKRELVDQQRKPFTPSYSYI